MNKELELIDIGCAQHQGRRQYQEDSFAFSNLSDAVFTKHGGFLAVVADGMGGLEHGEEASALSVKTFLNVYMSKRSSDDIPTTLKKALDKANDEVVSLAKKHSSLDNTGSTLTAAVIYDSKLYWVSVGDSRLYLYRGGELCQINNEHTYLQELYKKVARCELTREQAEADEDAEALTSFIGGLKEFDISQRHIGLEGGDIIILCSDGLYNTLSDREIVNIISSGQSADMIAKELINNVLKKGNQHQDNVTVLVLKIPVSLEEGKKGSELYKWIFFVILMMVLIATLYINLKPTEPPKVEQTNNGKPLKHEKTMPKEDVKSDTKKVTSPDGDVKNDRPINNKDKELSKP